MSDKCNCNEHEHDHEHECGCGCGEEEMQTITLTLEDDSEMECGVIGMFDLGEKSYIALLTDDDEVLLYGFEEIDEDSIDLINIDDEEEFEAVADAFNDIFEGDFEDEDEE